MADLKAPAICALEAFARIKQGRNSVSVQRGRISAKNSPVFYFVRLLFDDKVQLGVF